jgi:hypothetical protein
VQDIDGKHLAAAWEQLEQALTAANKHFLQYNDGGRTAAFKQLTAVNQFVSSVSTQSLLQIPLVALTLALHYLDHGVVEPMLRPRANKARRGRRPEHELLKVRSAVAMSQLYQIGYNRQRAAAQIAKELTKLGYKTTPRAIANWRDYFASLPLQHESAKVFHNMLASENKHLAIKGRTKASETDPESSQSPIAHEVIDLLRKYVLLARLTSSPDINKLIPQLKKAFT